MLGMCSHEFAPLVTVQMFDSKQAVMEQCVRCEKIRARLLTEKAEAKD